jgi:hypothetical protein
MKFRHPRECRASRSLPVVSRELECQKIWLLLFSGSLHSLDTFVSVQIKTWNVSVSHLRPYYAEPKDTRSHGEGNYCRIATPESNLYLLSVKI